MMIGGHAAVGITDEPIGEEIPGGGGAPLR